jgi:sugar (pentulose or hexulose) kinase
MAALSTKRDTRGLLMLCINEQTSAADTSRCAADPNGADLENLVLVGAGSNSSLWSQILADVLNVSIEVRGGVGSLDVNARGNAMIGEVALDSTASLELPSNVRHLNICAI